MGYRETCDNPACGVEIASAEQGRPMTMAKRRTYCTRCSALVEAVEVQLRQEATEKAMALADEVEERRVELMARMLPPQVFPEATAPEVARGEPPRGAWLIQVPE